MFFTGLHFAYNTIEIQMSKVSSFIYNTWFEKLYCCHANKIVIAMQNESITASHIEAAVQNLQCSRFQIASHMA